MTLLEQVEDMLLNAIDRNPEKVLTKQEMIRLFAQRDCEIPYSLAYADLRFCSQLVIEFSGSPFGEYVIRRKVV